MRPVIKLNTGRGILVFGPRDQNGNGGQAK
jgi:hypothetical protein